MNEYEGRLRLPGERGPGVKVHIDLDDEHCQVTSGEIEIGHWSLEELHVMAKEDGFHVLVEGEEIVLTTNDDPGFAVALGVRNAPPLLRRQISERMRELGIGADTASWSD